MVCSGSVLTIDGSFDRVVEQTPPEVMERFNASEPTDLVELTTERGVSVYVRPASVRAISPTWREQ